MNFLKKLFAPVDMTVGKPWEDILIFTVPMLLGNIAQQLYNAVDSVVVGNYVGDNALAAVGSAGPIINLLIVLFIGISVGASIMVSQYFGARNREALSMTIGSCITLTAIAGIVMTVVGLIVVRPLLVILNTPTSILEWSTSYLQIILLGSVGLAYYNILSGILRGLGDSISALVYLLVASGLNIVLDLLFVIYFDMGVNGVAWATILAQAVSAILCFLRLSKMKDLFELKPSHLKMSKTHVMNIVRLGVPSGVTQAIMSMAMLIVQSLTNSFGEQFIAANVIVMRVDGFAMLPNFSFGTTMTTYAGQNIGAGDQERVVKGSRQGLLLGVGTSAIITLAILIFGKHLMAIFTPTEELVELSMNMMRILAAGYIAMAVTQCLSGVMRGAGDTMTPMWISIVSTILIRVPLAYGMVWMTRSEQFPQGRRECIFISLLISWVLGALITSIFYKRGKWKGKAVK